MKEKYQKYIATGLTAFLVIAASILLFFLVFKIQDIRSAVRGVFLILEPFFVGAVIAYIIAPLYNLIVRNLEALFAKKLKQRRAHALAVGIALAASILSALFVIVGILALVIPRFVNSVIGIVNSLETYSGTILLFLENLLKDHPELSEQVESTYLSLSETFLNWVNSKMTPDAEAVLSSMSNLSAIISGVISGVKILVRLFKDFILGFIIAAYLLVAKRRLIAQAKKIVYSVLRLKTANYLLYQCRYIQNVFGGFIRGKLVDSLIIGILCFFGCTILRFPYPIVVSVIIGVTNIIPFFGPFVGAIPCALLILLVNPIKCLYFVIFILALQQFDGNVLGPKILGNTTGLSSFWVLFSIILFGGLFGFVGMIIAVPLFAVIYSLISTFVNHCLAKKEMPLETKEYELLNRVEEENHAFVHTKDPTKK